MTSSGKSRSLTGALVILGMLAIAGCVAGNSSTAPGADPTSSPNPSDIAGATVIEFSALRVEVLDDSGTVMAEHDYLSDADGLVALLTAAIGDEPSVHVPGTDDCSSATTYSWPAGNGGLFVSVIPDVPDEPFTPISIGTTVSEVGSVAIETSAGLAIGDDANGFIAGLAEDEHDDDAGFFIWDRTLTYQTDMMGALAFGGYGAVDESGVVTRLSAPGSMYSGFC